MRIKLLKLLDKTMGGLAARLIPSPVASVEIKNLSSILIIRPGGIGDAALLAPAIYSLKRRFPDADIDVLAERRNAGVFQLIPGIRQLFLYDNLSQLLKALQGRYDAVIDTEQWHRLSAVVARLTGAAVIIGFDTNDRRRLLTHPLPYSHYDYEAVSFLNLLEPLEAGDGANFSGSFLFAPEKAEGKALDLLSGVSGGFVTIFPGASIPERKWGAERFSEVARSLLSTGVDVVVIGGTEDFATGEIIAAGVRGLNLCGRTTLAETAAVIAQSKVLVTGDSGILHLGVGLNAPTVSLFGPGISAKWAPVGERHIVLNQQIPCSPCTRFGYTPPCSLEVSCLAGISVDEVVDATRKLLGSGFTE